MEYGYTISKRAEDPFRKLFFLILFIYISPLKKINTRNTDVNEKQ